MKGITLLIIGLVLILASVLAPRLLSSDSSDLVVILTRVPGVICSLIGLMRISRARRLPD
jgi:hypothetical protein